MKQTIDKQKIKEAKIQLFTEVNKIAKHVARLIQKKKTQITNLRSESENLCTDPTNNKMR